MSGNCPYCDSEQGINGGWGMSPSGWAEMKRKHDNHHKEEPTLSRGSSPLTPQFEFVSFPKVIKHKAVRNYRDGGFNSPTLANKTKKARKVASTLKFGKERLPSMSLLLEKANKAFSLFIKERDNWTCVLCGKTKETAIMTNGHLIKRGKKIHLFNELNCHCLCSGCNKLDNYDHDIYVNWFIIVYGLKRYQELVSTKDDLFQIKRGYLIYIINRYGSPDK
jgi:hypothetical protein